MPRVRQKETVYRNERFLREVRAQLAAMGMHQKDLVDRLGIKESTVSMMLHKPGSISVDRMRALIECLDLAPETVLRLLGYKGGQMQ